MGAIINRVKGFAEHTTLTMSGAAVRQRMKEKDLKRESEAGEKARAGRLLSTFLRAIAQEKIKLVDKDGMPRTVTKARALAEQMWNRALGTHFYVDEKTGEIKNPPPDKSMIDILFDRCEGKVGTHEEEVKKDASVPDKVSQANKEKLNKLAQKN